MFVRVIRVRWTPYVYQFMADKKSPPTVDGSVEVLYRVLNLLVVAINLMFRALIYLLAKDTNSVLLHLVGVQGIFIYVKEASKFIITHLRLL